MGKVEKVTENTVIEEVIDIEEYAKAGKNVPKDKKYKILVDKESYVFEESVVTGREILQKAGKVPPEQFILTQKLKGGKRERIELDQVVDLTQPGIERFDTMAIDPTEG